MEFDDTLLTKNTIDQEVLVTLISERFSFVCLCSQVCR